MCHSRDIENLLAIGVDPKTRDPRIRKDDNAKHNKNMKTKTKSPLVSVIIPVFNGASFLREAVDSVQKSTFTDFDIMLIDDGSTDHSRHICKDLEIQYANVHFHEFPNNRGLARVLNYALEHAKGTYICRLNQDDRMLPHRLATQVAYMESHKDVVASGSWIKLFFVNGKSQIVRFLSTDEKIKKMWHIVSPFADPSVMYRREVALMVGGYDQAMWPADDTHLWMRMGTVGKLGNIQKSLVEVRWHKKAASVAHFKTLALSTYRMHMYTHTYIDKASIFTHLFWLIQLICGLTLSPEFNWGVYRVMKRVINNKRIINIREKSLFAPLFKTAKV